MGRERGWILDAYVNGTEAVVWIKTEGGRALRLRDQYAPFFHVLCSPGCEEGIAYQISECPEVRRVCAEELIPSFGDRARQMLKVETWGLHLRRLAFAAKRIPGVEAVYNLPLSHVQRYLFTRLRAEPTSRVEADFDGDRLLAVRKLDDEEGLAPPPFSLAAFAPRMERRGGRWELRSVRCTSCGYEASGGEAHVLESFFDHLASEDPDLVLIPDLDRRFYPSIQWLSKEEGVPLRLGRCGDPYKRLQGSAAGRVFLGSVFYGFSADRWGIAGLVERSRFAFATMGQATRWLSNRAIDSRTSFELISRGHAVPEEDYRECARPLGELAARDRGGITFTPVPGMLYENVAALDFDSQYPSLILRDGISYESPYGSGGSTGDAGAPCAGDGRGKPILGSVIEEWLRRRLALKRLRRTLAEGTDDRRFCEERISAIKMILVTIYGVSGCCRNRFGNPVVFEEINRRSREAMVAAKRIADAKGFRVIYADVDSIFVTRRGASISEYADLAGTIGSETGLSISIDRHFKFLAFPRLRRDPSSSALKRYFGVTYDGEVVARGIEMRRGDMPGVVRRFQEGLIREVFSCRDSEEVLSLGVCRGRALLRRALREISAGMPCKEGLVVRRRLGKDPGSYKVSTAERSAALQLLALGKGASPGEEVEFVRSSASHQNPLCRVRIPDLFSGNFDRAYYGRLLTEAARVVFESIGAGEVADRQQASLVQWMG
ncbi:MAG: DNA polymerase domain-containing protein [Candidatus Methanosuratincola verstraetei]